MIKKIVVTTIIIIFLHNVYSYAEPIDLSESDLYVKQGFEKEWITDIPDESDDNWQKFPAKKDNRPVRARQLNFKGLPKFKHFSIQKYSLHTFTYVTSFDISEEKIKTEHLGLLLGQIGQNWEVYLNGKLIKSEVHLSKDKSKIIVERAVRNELIYINPNNLKVGPN